MNAADYEQLRALFQRYARAADARDLDALRALFHPDAVIDGTRGRMNLAQWMEAMATPAGTPTSMHMIGDPLIEVDPDGTSARLDAYAVVYQIGDAPAGRPDMTLGMRYQDRAVCAADGWLIIERVVRTVWVR